MSARFSPVPTKVMRTSLGLHFILLFATLSAVRGNATGDEAVAVAKFETYDGNISLRDSSGWFEWLFASSNNTSGTALTTPLPVDGRPIGRSSSPRNETSPEPERQSCLTANGTFGLCQPIRHCVMADPDTGTFAVCRTPTADRLCCPEVSPNELPSLEQKYKAFLEKQKNAVPAFAENLPETTFGSDDICGLVPLFSHNSKKRLKNKTERVVNGEDAHIGELPWMATIYYKNIFICGGAIVSRYHIVTAAHCLFSKKHAPQHFSVRYGSVKVNNGTFNLVRRIFVHPDYAPPVIYNDIAILRVIKPIEFSNYVQPVCLPGENMFGDAMVNQTVTVAGHGDTRFGGKQSERLQLLQMKVLPNALCDKSYNKLNDAKTKFRSGITKSLICAGYLEGGKDACQGDSGGPLSFEYRGRHYLPGLVSFGYRCAEPLFPGVYTSLSAQRDFLEKALKH